VGGAAAHLRNDCSGIGPYVQHLIDVFLFLLRSHGPIIVDIVYDLGWNHMHYILIFLVELLEGVGLVEERPFGRDLGLTLLIFIFFFLVADLVTAGLSRLTVQVLLEVLDVILVVCFPLGACLNDIILTPLLSIFFLLNLVGAVLLSTPCGDLSASDVQLATG